MLILTRRVGESIRIGEDIILTVLGVRGRSVKLGIGAPDSCKVWREELDNGGQENTTSPSK